VIFVNDRLNDTSAIVIAAKALADKRSRLIKLSRNFGHRIAITAGLITRPAAPRETTAL
jgi:glycosyltransferase involved in cell wall biosynthesis